MTLFPPRQTVLRSALKWMINVVAILVTLEISSRYFTNQNDKIVVLKDSCHVIKPGLDMKKINNESGRLVRVQTNSLGFRDREPVIPKPHGISRIAIVGDSFVAGMQVESQERFSELLEHRLHEEDSLNHWEVLNFGVMGTGPVDQHLRYLHYIRQCEPDIVILCFGMEQDFAGSDLNPHRSLADTQRETVPTDNRSAEFSVQNMDFVAFKSFLDSNLKFYEWQKARMDFLKYRLAPTVNYHPASRTIHKFEKYYFAPLTVQQQESVQYLTELLPEFRDDVESDGAKFLMVGLPTGISVYEETWQNLVHRAREQGFTRTPSRDQPINLLSSICNKTGIPLLPLEQKFRRGYESGELETHRNLNYNRKGHLTPYGHEVVENFLYEFLQSQPSWREPAKNTSEQPQQIAEEFPTKKF